MLSLPRRRTAPLAVAVVALALAGCQSPPPEPELTPRSGPQLEPRVSECDSPPPAPTGDTAFTAELTASPAGGMRMSIDIEAAGGAGHGEHELGSADLRIVDAAGRVTGVVMADAWRETAGLRGTLEVELGSCPDDSGSVGYPLVDGNYAIVASGYIRPLDHAHAQAEVWVAEPLAIVVEDGAIQP